MKDKASDFSGFSLHLSWSVLVPHHHYFFLETILLAVHGIPWSATSATGTLALTSNDTYILFESSPRQLSLLANLLI